MGWLAVLRLVVDGFCGVMVLWGGVLVWVCDGVLGLVAFCRGCWFSLASLGGVGCCCGGGVCDVASWG